MSHRGSGRGPLPVRFGQVRQALLVDGVRRGERRRRGPRANSVIASRLRTSWLRARYQSVELEGVSVRLPSMNRSDRPPVTPARTPGSGRGHGPLGAAVLVGRQGVDSARTHLGRGCDADERLLARFLETPFTPRRRSPREQTRWSRSTPALRFFQRHCRRSRPIAPGSRLAARDARGAELQLKPEPLASSPR